MCWALRTEDTDKDRDLRLFQSKSRVAAASVVTCRRVKGGKQ